MKREKKLVALGVTAILLAACGGKTLLEEGEAGAGGTSGSGGGTAGTAGTGGSGVAGTGGGVAGTGGGVAGTGGGVAGTGGGVAGTGGGVAGTGGTAGGISGCGQTHDTVEMSARLYDGSFYTCWGGSNGEIEVSGRVIDSYPDGFTVDSCPPDMDCAGGMYSEFRVSSPGLEVTIPWSALVRVRFSVQSPWGCEQRILVRNLPQWEGEPNPVSSGRELYLAAADGTLATFQGTPFIIESYGLGCYPGAQSCGEPADDHVLDFRSNNGASNLTLGMGATGEWLLTYPEGSQQSFTARNLRSYVSGACDDYWNWAYWMTPTIFYPYD